MCIRGSQIPSQPPTACWPPSFTKGGPGHTFQLLAAPLPRGIFLPSLPMTPEWTGLLHKKLQSMKVFCLLFWEILFFSNRFVDAYSPHQVKHEKCMQVGCSEMSIEKSKCSEWCWRGCWCDKSSDSWQRSWGWEEEEGKEDMGKEVCTARWGLLNHVLEGPAPRHTLFKGVIQSVSPDAKSFVTRWPFQGPVLSVSYFLDLSLLPLPLTGNDDRYTHALQISSIGHYYLHQRSCYAAKSLMDDGYRNGFPAKWYPNTLFNAGNVSCWCCFWHRMIKFHGVLGLIRLKIAVVSLPYCYFPSQTKVLNNGMAVSRCECHGGHRCLEFRLPRQPSPPRGQMKNPGTVDACG